MRKDGVRAPRRHLSGSASREWSGRGPVLHVWRGGGARGRLGGQGDLEQGEGW